MTPSGDEVRIYRYPCNVTWVAQHRHTCLVAVDVRFPGAGAFERRAHDGPHTCHACGLTLTEPVS